MEQQNQDDQHLGEVYEVVEGNEVAYDEATGEVYEYSDMPFLQQQVESFQPPQLVAQSQPRVVTVASTNVVTIPGYTTYQVEDGMAVYNQVVEGSVIDEQGNIVQTVTTVVGQEERMSIDSQSDKTPRHVRFSSPLKHVRFISPRKNPPSPTSHQEPAYEVDEEGVTAATNDSEETYEEDPSEAAYNDEEASEVVYEDEESSEAAYDEGPSSSGSAGQSSSAGPSSSARYAGPSSSTTYTGTSSSARYIGPPSSASHPRPSASARYVGTSSTTSYTGASSSTRYIGPSSSASHNRPLSSTTSYTGTSSNARYIGPSSSVRYAGPSSSTSYTGASSSSSYPGASSSTSSYAAASSSASYAAPSSRYMAPASASVQFTVPAQRATFGPTPAKLPKTAQSSLTRPSPTTAQINVGPTPLSADYFTGSKPRKVNKRAMRRLMPGKRKPCNCTKSQCLKLYCECFANGEFCYDCNCRDCHNNLEFNHERSRAIKMSLERNPNAFKPKIGVAQKGKNADIERLHQKGCHCKKSNCLKNYCECYEAKVACTSRCKCRCCRNTEADRQVRFSDRFTAISDFGRRSPGSEDDDTPYEPDLPQNLRTQVYYYLTDEVVEATTLCLMAQAHESQQQGMDKVDVVKSLCREFGTCLGQIFDATRLARRANEQAAAEYKANLEMQDKQMYKGEDLKLPVVEPHKEPLQAAVKTSKEGSKVSAPATPNVSTPTASKVTAASVSKPATPVVSKNAKAGLSPTKK